MHKFKLITIVILSLFISACNNSKKKTAENHGHEGHNHEIHEEHHEGHDHEHEGHDHEGHNHNHEAFEAHDHEGHSHEGHNHDHEVLESHDHEGHSHETDIFFYSSYNESFEVFVEAGPFVSGQENKIIAHFTSLANFKPLRSGVISASIIVGNDKVSHTLNMPDKPGVYNFKLKSSKTGTGELRFEIKTSEGVSHAIIPNIKVVADIHDVSHVDSNPANSVSFSKEQSWKVDFATEEAIKEPFGQAIKTTAQILPSDADEQILTAKADGIVIFPQSILPEGKKVSNGQTLLQIESSSLADNNLNIRYQQAVSEYNRAKAEYERKAELAKDKIVSESDLLSAKTEFVNAETNYKELQKNFSSGKQVINSPINGFVKQVFVKNGEFVTAGQSLATVSQNRELLIRADVQPKFYPLLGKITSANLRFLNNSQSRQLEGELVSYGKSVSAENHLIPVIFKVANSPELLPGSFIDLYINTKTENQAITVPNDAILEEMGNYFVFVQVNPILFEKRIITKGVTDGIKTEIKEGISVGERVVSKGATMVKLAQSAGALDPHAGHVH